MMNEYILLKMSRKNSLLHLPSEAKFVQNVSSLLIVCLIYFRVKYNNFVEISRKKLLFATPFQSKEKIL